MARIRIANFYRTLALSQGEVLIEVPQTLFREKVVEALAEPGGFARSGGMSLLLGTNPFLSSEQVFVLTYSTYSYKLLDSACTT